MKDLRAVFFDFDGTLVDSERFYFEAWKPILKQHFAVDLDFETWIQYFAGHTLARNILTMKELWGVDVKEEFMWKSTRENYANQDMLTIPLMPHARELIDFLMERDIQMGLVTSNFRPTVERMLEHYGLLQHFSWFVTREDVVNPKPNPTCYQKALLLSGFDTSEVVAVEDTATGSRAAYDAGLTCIAVTKQKAERDRLDFVDHLLFDLKEVNDLLR
ncbi:haloacid dehalogenase [Sphingobacterium faecium NBRC 15299]|uniref:HAD family hydrolase n=1 Tax=Sphingobacterium faecium TaxID=34087 RepID=UPI000D3C7B7E|nr:HAD family phosphatase [Sphingobacterium faecium]MQP29220.1 HAD-IA family hydrolase [Sphingobacterium faecium]PTX12830.1 HAD superfamily hydrolase (TIGR01509 family) [Sphingobacterium faecium]GEM62531.1 haloacid dehalogenase [Sphingobacterium faecium NBRC 15299]